MHSSRMGGCEHLLVDHIRERSKDACPGGLPSEGEGACLGVCILSREGCLPRREYALSKHA